MQSRRAFPRADDTHPNIVLVTADSLRADHCGFLGDGDLTPALDALATNAIVFENAIAPGPQTFSSLPAVFTGSNRIPDMFRRQDGATNWERRLAALSAHLDQHTPFQERLQEIGYTTAAFTPNPWTSRAAGFARGFDYFADLSTTDRSRWTALAERLPGVTPDGKLVELGLDKLTDSGFFAQWNTYYDDVLTVRDRLRQPYFLWIFLLDTHIPYLTARAHRHDTWLPLMYYSVLRAQPVMRGHATTMPTHVEILLRRSYRDAVRAVDAFVERLTADFEADSPVIVFHADHGESLGEHGLWGHHHRRVYEENIHVPYLIANAGVRSRVSPPVSLKTIPDTIHNLAQTGTVDPLTRTTEVAIAQSELGNHQAVRGQRWKFIDGTDPKLFDLQADPDEQTNIAPTQPAIVDSLQRHLNSYHQHKREESWLQEAIAELATGVEV